jgi:hypothetical protein
VCVCEQVLWALNLCAHFCIYAHSCLFLHRHVHHCAHIGGRASKELGPWKETRTEDFGKGLVIILVEKKEMSC